MAIQSRFQRKLDAVGRLGFSEVDGGGEVCQARPAFEAAILLAVRNSTSLYL